jgi:hypothetical protein
MLWGPAIGGKIMARVTAKSLIVAIRRVRQLDREGKEALCDEIRVAQSNLLASVIALMLSNNDPCAHAIACLASHSRRIRELPAETAVDHGKRTGEGASAIAGKHQLLRRNADSGQAGH